MQVVFFYERECFAVSSESKCVLFFSEKNTLHLWIHQCDQLREGAGIPWALEPQRAPVTNFSFQQTKSSASAGTAQLNSKPKHTSRMSKNSYTQAPKADWFYMSDLQTVRYGNSSYNTAVNPITPYVY